MISKVLCISTRYPVHVGTRSQTLHPLPPRKPVLVLEEPNLAAQKRQSYSATLPISSVTVPFFDVAFFSCLLWTCAPSKFEAGSGDPQGLPPGSVLESYWAIELGEHMPTREYDR